MTVRSDLDKIVKYTKSHNVKLILRLRKPKGEDCAWILFETKTIVVTYKRGDSIKELCASILHELTHLISYSLDKNAFKDYLRVNDISNPTKEERKIIYLQEKNDIVLMPKIHKLLRLESIPLNYIKMWRDYDTWQYKYYYEKGKFPCRAVKIAKREKLNLKWKL